ncbi:putative phospholipid-transporting ATPase IF [Fasciola hepatica]|uniref:Phospholipid-transporting ATPase IF n=1 Tax=Fasciola hepatica TaxID=6192 RepID=A0A4E0RWU4_FASHE|nr:putative phospholipid-transporting ATPase IF [Fasciola hepatica]
MLSNLLPRFRVTTFVPIKSVSALVSAETNSSQTPLEKRLHAWNKVHRQNQYDAMTPYAEKITVEYMGKIGEPCSLQMTKRLSSPIDCAKHLSKLLVDRSIVAMVNGLPWGMHRPLVEDCTLDFVHLKDAHHDPVVANRAFWCSASFLLAATLETAFHTEHAVRLLRTWPTEPEHGSFVCDITFTPTKTEESPQDSRVPWIPSKRELSALSAHGQQLASDISDFVPVQVSSTHELFALCCPDDASHSDQLKSNISARYFYRMGNFVQAHDDDNDGPLISSTRMFGRFAVTRCYALGWLYDHTPSLDYPMGVMVYRVHGTALPSAFPTHFTTFERLVQWSREPNPGVPAKPDYVIPF